MVNNTPCHEYCTDLVEKEIRESVRKIQGVREVSFVYPVGIQGLDGDVLHKDSPGKDSLQAAGQQEDFTHTFLVSVVVPCYQESTASVSMEGSCSPGDSMRDGDSATAPLEYAIQEEYSADAVQQGFTYEEIGGIQSLLDDSSKSGGSNDVVNAMELEFGFNENNNYDEGLYPLSRSELQHTIIQQLDKSQPPVVFSFPNLFKDISTSCFGDNVSEDAASVPCTAADQTVLNTTISVNQVAFKKQQQQSNEISSSSWGTSVAASCCQIIPQIAFADYYSDFSTMIEDTPKANLAISSTQNQLFCPANLPAVSAFVAGANGNAPANWTYSQLSAAAATSSHKTNLRQKQHRHAASATGTSRPALLLPKTALPNSKRSEDRTSTEKIRSRKTNPILKTSSSSSNTEHSISQFPDDRPFGAPEGHTYQSYIITEGLVKVRQQMRQERKQQAQGRKKSNRNMTDEYEERGTSSTTPVATKGERKPYFCSLCQKTYRSANGLKYHAQNGPHGPKAAPFPCKYCGKEYASRHGLAGHEKTHEIRAGSMKMEVERDQRELVIGT